MQHYLLTLSKFTDFKGRTGRKEFWMFTLFHFLAFIICLIIDNVFGITFGSLMEAMTGFPKEQLPYGVFYMLYSLITFVPSLAVMVRRLHDIGKSGWFYLLSFIPLVGAIILIVWFCKEGQKEANQWGENPLLNIKDTQKINTKIPIIMGGLLLGLGIVFGGMMFGARKYLEKNLTTNTDYLSEEELLEENLSDYSLEEETDIERLDISEIEQMAKNDFQGKKYELIEDAVRFFNANSEYDQISTNDVEVTIVKTYTGDLSGDGLEDIVIWYDVRVPADREPLSQGVLLYENTGNTAEFRKNNSGGGLDGYSNVEIRNGRVILSWLEHRDSDPYCCPTKKQTESIGL